MKKLLLLPFFLFTFGSHAQSFWTEVAPFESATNFTPRQISIVNADVVWVEGNANNNPTALDKWSYSTDSGITWTSGDINVGDIHKHISSIFGISATTAYATVYPDMLATTGGGVWVTHDSGLTWTQQPSAIFNTTNASFANFIHFWDVNHGIVAGDAVNGHFEIYTTADGGTNWIAVPAGNLPSQIDTNEYGLIGSYDVNANTIWFGTTYGRLFKSDNNGLNWNVSQTPVTDFGGGINGTEEASYSFKDQNNGLLISTQTDTNGSFKFWRTIDGISWNNETPTGTLRDKKIISVPQTANTYFNIGSDNQLARGSSYSTDGGYTWHDLNLEDENPIMPVSVEFQSGTVGFCIGYGAGDLPTASKFYRLTDPLNRLNGTLTNKDFIKSVFIATPNPTNGIVKLSGAGINRVLITDITGKTVFSQNYSSLNEVSVDITSFENGIYLANVSSPLGNSSTLKIIKN